MNSKREFEIAWQGLRIGLHSFEYHIDNTFLKRFDTDVGNEVKELKAIIKVDFEKNASFFRLRFDIDGTALTTCDRCGDELMLRLWDEFKLLIKLADDEELREEEAEDDIAIIPRSETVIDLSRWMYEYLLLSIPMHRIHNNEVEGENGCNPEALRLLQQLNHVNEDKPNDLWQGLKKLNIDKK